jgi:hypothetical protein
MKTETLKKAKDLESIIECLKTFQNALNNGRRLYIHISGAGVYLPAEYLSEFEEKVRKGYDEYLEAALSDYQKKLDEL